MWQQTGRRGGRRGRVRLSSVRMRKGEWRKSCSIRNNVSDLFVMEKGRNCLWNYLCLCWSILACHRWGGGGEFCLAHGAHTEASWLVIPPWVDTGELVKGCLNDRKSLNCKIQSCQSKLLTGRSTKKGAGIEVSWWKLVQLVEDQG